jgi:hypothetical protein
MLPDLEKRYNELIKINNNLRETIILLNKENKILKIKNKLLDLKTKKL